LVPIPTKLLALSTTRFVPPTVKPAAIVDVAVVDVAIKFPNVGVEVATTTPLEFVERIELTATLGRFRAPENVDDAVLNSPPVNPITVDVEL
jgi:hypothetical protein